MTYRAGVYVAIAGLLTAVICGVPALILLALFGLERNGAGFFDAHDLIVMLAVMGSLGLAVLVVGLVAAGSQERRFGRVAAAFSLACLVAVVPWLEFCLIFFATSPDEFQARVATPLVIRTAAAGAGALAALGSLLGFAALPGGVRGLAAFCLNVLVLAAAGVALFAQVGTGPG